MDWHSPAASQLALASFIREGHLARHIRKMRRLYALRRARIINAIGPGGRLRLLPSAAGLHVGATLRSGKPLDDVILGAWELGGGRARRMGTILQFDERPVLRIRPDRRGIGRRGSGDRSKAARLTAKAAALQQTIQRTPLPNNDESPRTEAGRSMLLSSNTTGIIRRRVLACVEAGFGSSPRHKASSRRPCRPVDSRPA